MQCSACRAVFSNGLDICPRCQTPAAKSSPKTEPRPTRPLRREEIAPSQPLTVETTPVEMAEAGAALATTQKTSTLIEFPGTSRASRPQWRKDLSERVREIQERRARESAREAEAETQRRLQEPQSETAQTQLGLVPQPDAPAPNPLVVAALKRIERARQSPTMPRTRTAKGGAATAVAHFVEEQYQSNAKPEPALHAAPAPKPAALAVPTPAPAMETATQVATDTATAQTAETAATSKTTEAARERTLVAVPLQPDVEAKTTIFETADAQPLKRGAVELREEKLLESFVQEDALPVSEEYFYDDRAPVVRRLLCGFLDLLIVAFASSPFAAIIELTNGNWLDIRVAGSMGGIVLVVMFLYLSASIALAGKTWGMSLLSLRAVNADTGEPPTTRQAIGRAFTYMLSLAALGLGILYALFDAEGRTVYDHLSGTAIVKE